LYFNFSGVESGFCTFLSLVKSRWRENIRKTVRNISRDRWATFAEIGRYRPFRFASISIFFNFTHIWICDLAGFNFLIWFILINGFRDPKFLRRRILEQVLHRLAISIIDHQQLLNNFKSWIWLEKGIERKVDWIKYSFNENAIEINLWSEKYSELQHHN
jgi:hypothetical protein